MSFKNNWNIMTQFAAFPCAQPSPIIIAITLIPAIAPALLEWISFGCRDILKFRLGKGVPCGRAMKLQVMNAVPPSLTDVVTHLLKWEHHFSQAGQLFLLADLTGDTLGRWTTLAYQMSGCPDALEGAYWSVEFDAPQALNPGRPHAIGGRIIDERGNPGIAWPTGAIVPEGWYFTAHWQVEARSLPAGGQVSLDTWLTQTGGGGFDYPSNHYPPGRPGASVTAHYLAQIQNHKRPGPTFYSYTAMSQEFALTTGFKATCQCTPFPPYEEFLSPLSCLQGGFPEHIDDPAGRNPARNRPSIIGSLLGDQQPPRSRGRPGGKPRSRR